MIAQRWGSKGGHDTLWPPMSSPRPGRDQILGKTACCILGAILLFASYAKLLEPGGFVEQIHLEGLDFWLPATLIAVVAMFLETLLGVLLLLGVTNRVVLAGSTVLISFFLYLTGRNYWLVARGLRDPDSACGCFGSLIERTAGEAFWQDLLMLGFPVIVAIRFLPRDLIFPPWRSLVAVGVSVAVSLLMARSPSLVAAGAALRIAEEEVPDRPLVPVRATVFVNDEEDIEAEVYIFEADASFVVVSALLGQPFLLNPRQRSVHVIGSEDLHTDPAGGRRLAASLQRQAEGSFEMLADGIHFSVKGTSVRLIPH